jgi:hypothetical protein
MWHQEGSHHMKAERSIHLVGSLPADNANDAMHLALTTCGKHLHTLTDGETGGDWVIPIVESLRKNPLLTVRINGRNVMITWATLSLFKVTMTHVITLQVICYFRKTIMYSRCCIHRDQC